MTGKDYDGAVQDFTPGDPVWLSATIVEVHQTRNGTWFQLMLNDNSTRLPAVDSQQMKKR
jgi:hypothetical protein